MATQLTDNLKTAPTTPAQPASRRIRAAQIEVSEIVKTVDKQAENGEPKKISVQVDFGLVASQARSVAVAGSFNGWDPTVTPMRKVEGAWHVKVGLPRGRHEYRFVVDGQWMADPGARESVPNPFGSVNSVLNV